MTPRLGIYVVAPDTMAHCTPLLYHYVKELRQHFVGGMLVLSVAEDGNSARVLMVPDTDAPQGPPPEPGMERVTTPHVMLVDATRIGTGGATEQ